MDKEILRGFIGYLKAQGTATKTIENYFSVLSSFYEYLTYEGIVDTAILLLRSESDIFGATKIMMTARPASSFLWKIWPSLINCTMDIRDKAVITLLAKTGIRRHELVELDVSDVDLIENEDQAEAHCEEDQPDGIL